jgi:hypothetical protein
MTAVFHLDKPIGECTILDTGYLILVWNSGVVGYWSVGMLMDMRYEIPDAGSAYSDIAN